MEGFHVDVAGRAAGEGPDFGFVLKGSSDLREIIKNNETR